MSKDRQPSSRDGGPAPSRARLGLLAAFALALTLVLVACGGDSSSDSEGAAGVVQADDLAQPAQEPDAAASGKGELAAADSGVSDTESAAETTEEISPEDAFLVFAQCLRDEGLDVSDPDFSSGRGPGGFLRGIDREDPAVEAALEACRPLIENARSEATPEEQAERQDQLLAFTACLRDQGLDVDDPDLSGGGPSGGGFRVSLDPDDPDVQAAIELCRDEIPGFGGGRFGGGGRG